MKRQVGRAITAAGETYPSRLLWKAIVIGYFLHKIYYRHKEGWRRAPYLFLSELRIAVNPLSVEGLPGYYEATAEMAFF